MAGVGVVLHASVMRCPFGQVVAGAVLVMTLLALGFPHEAVDGL